MDDESGPVAAAGPDDGTGAVLYGMFTSFTEALDDLDGRLAAIEAAVRSGPSDIDARLAALEGAVRSGPSGLDHRLTSIAQAVEGVRTVHPGADDRLGAVEAAMVGAQAGVEARLAAVEAAVLAGSPEVESRLAAIETAARTVPPELSGRLAALEASMDELSGLLRERADAAPVPLTDGGTVDKGALLDARAAVADQLRDQSDLLERRTADLAAAVESVRALVQSHVDETAHSLGRRAGEVGRRLAGDLGLRSRPKPPSLGP